MTKGCKHVADLGRRQFLRGSGIAAAGGIAATVAPSVSARAAAPLAGIQYPSQKIGNVKELKVDDAKDITYPDAESPGFLLKLGKEVEGGVGPEKDIVAFSAMCPHKGFPLNYIAADKSLNCPGHYSRFDCEAGGQQIWGQATANLPQFTLRVDANGDIYAEAVDELIYGRTSNILGV